MPVQVETSATGEVNLLSFVQSLYTQGAQAGDYAIIRLNDDRANSAPNAGGTGGYRVGFQEHATLKPELRLFDATVIDWDNASGGDYGTTGNWLPNNVPDNSTATETARFKLDATYGVEFASGSTTTATDLLVNRGAVNFQTAVGSTANATHNLNDQMIVGGGTLVIADSASGFDIDVNVANEVTINDGGTLQINGGVFAAGSTITMSNGSTLTLDGGTLTANGGLDNSAVGTLDHQDGRLTIHGGMFQPNAGGAIDDYSVDGPTIAELPHLVIGEGATATIDGIMSVGASQRGELTIEGGGRMENLSLSVIGSSPGAMGTVTITGADSIWVNANLLRVGGFGQGALNIEAGGRAENGVAIAGSNLRVTGTVKVTGTDSIWAKLR